MWIDEGEVRGEADRARRPGAVAPPAPPAPPTRTPTPPTRRSRRAVAASGARAGRAAPPGGQQGLQAGSASTRPARSCGRWPSRRPTAESVRELLGLTYYRLGRWKLGRHRARGVPRPQRLHRAAPGAGRLLPGARAPRARSPSCGRSCGPRRPAPPSWPRAASSHAGSLADQGRLDDAIRAPRAPPSRPPSAPRSTTCASPTRWPTSTSGPATCRGPGSSSRRSRPPTRSSATSTRPRPRAAERSSAAPLADGCHTPRP